MKKFLVLLICFTVLLTITVSNVSAVSNSAGPAITIDGKQLNVNAIIEKGHTLVPLKAIFEKFGAKVEYNSSSKTIVAKKEGLVVTYMIGDNFAYANDKLINLKAPPVVKNGVTFIPLRFAAEAFGANILWNGSSKTVIIRSPENNVHPSIAEIRSALVEPQYYISKAMGFPDQKAVLHITANVKEQVITLTNISNNDLDMSNWSIKEWQKNSNFVFPKGFVLPAGQNVKISIGNNIHGDLSWKVQQILNEGKPNRIDLNTPSNEIFLIWEG